MSYDIAQLGELEIVEVYDYYDGPKFFSVRDRTSSFYTVYWCDLLDGAEGWLYLPISEKRLDRLRRREISVRDAYLEPEKGYWLVYTRVSPKKSESISYFGCEDVNPAFIPPEGMFVDYVDVIEEGESNWSHELKIEKNSANTTPSAEAATIVFGLWTEIIESIMNILSKSQQIHFASALPGSLEVKVGATNSETANKALYYFDEIIETASLNDDLEHKLYRAGLEPYKLRYLFETLRSENLNIRITPRVYGDISKPIVIKHSESDAWIQRLEPLTSRILGTDKIPQADEIGKIVDIIRYKANGQVITPELLNITQRQVRYYEDAAENLGLLDRNRHLTSIGRFVNDQKSFEEKLASLAIRFESSDCGWSWIKWSNVGSLVDLNEDTASEFLMSVAPGLSESTANRRASTLRLWLRKLRPYHYKYQG